MKSSCDSLTTVRPLMRELCDLVLKNMDLINSHRFDFEIKSDGSPVTKADKLVEELIFQHLSKRIPGVQFVGEESYDASLVTDDKGFVAILDPIDGTENFCSGLKEWGVSFTLWKDGAHMGSMLYMPELGESLMTGDQIVPINSRIQGFSSSMCPEIVDSLSSSKESRIMGCAVYNLINVIRGSFASFTNPKGAYVWDLLPGLMLAIENNLKVKVNGRVYNGEFLQANQRYRVDIRQR